MPTLQKIQRQEKILTSLQRLTFLSRSQIQRVNNIGSYRTTTNVLNDLKPYLSCFFDGENIYYLNKKGRDRIGSKKIVKKSPQVHHYLMRNDLYLMLNKPATWKNEVKVKDYPIICDAYYENRGRITFIEVDCTQRMNQNRKKIERYKKVVADGVFRKTPDFIWLTTTEHRRRRLAEMCKGLNVRIYTTDDLR